jgi:hypothetical protein
MILLTSIIMHTVAFIFEMHPWLRESYDDPKPCHMLAFDLPLKHYPAARCWPAFALLFSH